jgi:hypothetical protein
MAHPGHVDGESTLSHSGSLLLAHASRAGHHAVEGGIVATPIWADSIMNTAPRGPSERRHQTYFAQDRRMQPITLKRRRDRLGEFLRKYERAA